MKVNIYDFDGTIYSGDSSIDLYKFCVKKNKKSLIIIPKLLLTYILYFIRKKNKTEVKEVFFSFLKYFDNIDNILEEFWEINKFKIKKFYLEKDHSNDIIISASPEFLLLPICKVLKVKDLIASEVDKKNGMFLSLNCKGPEKVKRLYQKYNNIEVLEIYTDSYSDKTLISISKKAFLVTKEKVKKVK